MQELVKNENGHQEFVISFFSQNNYKASPKLIAGLMQDEDFVNEFNEISIQIFKGKTPKINNPLFLELLSKLSFKVNSYEDYSNYKKLIKIFNICNNYKYNYVCNGILDNIFFINNFFKKNESDYQTYFKEHHKSLIPNSNLIKVKTDPKNIPDAWIELDGEKIPVEIKMRNIDAKALKQINRYIEFYKTNKGIVAAQNLTVELPKNITFIKLPNLIK